MQSEMIGLKKRLELHYGKVYDEIINSKDFTQESLYIWGYLNPLIFKILDFCFMEGEVCMNTAKLTCLIEDLKKELEDAE